MGCFSVGSALGVGGGAGLPVGEKEDIPRILVGEGGVERMVRMVLEEEKREEEREREREKGEEEKGRTEGKKGTHFSP